jgi:hypothetical protein
LAWQVAQDFGLSDGELWTSWQSAHGSSAWAPTAWAAPCVLSWQRMQLSRVIVRSRPNEWQS